MDGNEISEEENQTKSNEGIDDVKTQMPKQNDLQYMLQLRKSGLYSDTNWMGEALARFQEMFEPLLDGTEYHLERSGEKTQIIYELKLGSARGRILGFKVLQTEKEKGNGKGRIRAFFDHKVYVMVKSNIGLPDNDLPNKTQEHVYITLEKLWDVICIITNKKDKLL